MPIRARFLSPFILLAACNAGTGASAQSAQSAAPFTVTPVADFKAPWSLAFLPDQRMLVTQKDGSLTLVSSDRLIT